MRKIDIYHKIENSIYNNFYKKIKHCNYIIHSYYDFYETKERIGYSIHREIRSKILNNTYMLDKIRNGNLK